jgi:cell shape-determining protein MreC
MLSHKIESLELDIERLENEVAEKDARIRAYDEASAASEDHTASVVVMYPLAEDVTSLYSTILLSKGYKDGVEENAMVYVRGRQAVCTVIKVYNETSLCELLSKGRRVVEGVTASSSVTLSLVGEGGGSFIMQIPSDVPIDIGETVYLRSDHSFTLGTVVSIKKDEQATGSVLYVRGAYNPVTSSVLYTDITYEN